MIDVVTMFREGGPFQYLILLLAIVFMAAPIIALVLAVLRVRAPAAVWIAVGMLPLLVGAVGTYQGQGMALQAVGSASAEMKNSMAAYGFAVSLYTLVFGGLVSGGLLSAMAAGLGIGTAVSPGSDARLSGAMIPGLLLVLVSPVPAFFGLYMVVPMMALSALGLTLVGLRFPIDPEGADAPRVAAARATVGVLGALALFAGGVASVTMGGAMMYTAMGSASPEMKAMLVASAQSSLVPSAAVPAVSATLLLLTGAAIALASGKALFQPRTLGLAAFAGLVLFLPMTIATGLVAFPSLSLLELATPFGLTREASLASADVDLPTADTDRQVYGAYPTLQFAAARITLDDDPITADRYEPVRHLNIEADGTLSLVPVTAFFLEGPKQQLHLAVQTPIGIRASTVTVMGSASPPPFPSNGDYVLDEIPDRFEPLTVTEVQAFPSEGRWWIRTVNGKGEGDPGQAFGERSAFLAALKENAGDRDVVLWLHQDDTVQDLVDAVGAIRGDPQQKTEVTWRLDAPPTPRMDAVLADPPMGEAPPRSGRSSGTSQLGEGRTTVDDPARVKQTVRRYAGQLKYCYETRLADKPELEGRVELGWSLEAGRVTSVYVVGNTSGDNELAACMVQKLKRWKFDPTLDGDVSWPFVFRPATP